MISKKIDNLQCFEYDHFEGDIIVNKNHNKIVITITKKKTLQELIVSVVKMDVLMVSNAIINNVKKKGQLIKN